MFHWVILALQIVTLKRVCGKKSKCGNLAELNLSAVLGGFSGGVICALDFFVDRIFIIFPVVLSDDNLTAMLETNSSKTT